MRSNGAVDVGIAGSEVIKPAVDTLNGFVLLANGRSFLAFALVVLVQIVWLFDIDPPTLRKGCLLYTSDAADEL